VLRAGGVGSSAGASLCVNRYRVIARAQAPELAAAMNVDLQCRVLV